MARTGFKRMWPNVQPDLRSKMCGLYPLSPRRSKHELKGTIKMNKQQLIQSFNEMKQSLEPIEVVNKTIPTLTWVCIAVGVLITIWFIRGLAKPPLTLKNIFWPSVIALFIIPVTFFFYLAYAIYIGENKPIVLNTSEKMKIENSWKSDVLYDQYLNNLQREKFEVMDYKITTNEGVTVILDTDKPISVIDNVRDVKWVDIEKPYVLAVWVEGLSEVGFNNQFYNTTLFMPKEEE